jgi:hypothetical protein
MRKDLNGFLYEELSDVEMLQSLNQFKELLINFDSHFKGFFDDYTYSIPLIYEIYRRIDQRADYYLYFHSDPKGPMKMSQTKEIALMVFWVLKYKPLSLPAHKADCLFIQKNCTINEYFAAYILFSYATKMSSRKDVEDYFCRKNNDILVYNFMHRDISKEAMIFYVDSLLNIVED